MIDLLKRLFPYRILFPLLIIDIIASFLLVLITNFSALDSIQTSVNDFDFTDFVYDNTGEDSLIVDSTIVLVNVGWTERNKIAQIIKNINQYNPAVIGLDIKFTDLKNPLKDALLKEALSEVENLVMASGAYWGERNNIDSIKYSNEYFMHNANPGFSNWFFSTKRGFSNPWSIRKYTTYGEIDNIRHYPFALEVLKLYNAGLFTSYAASISNEAIINYSGNVNNFITFDVDEGQNNDPSLKILRNKIVILGYLGDSLNRPDFEQMLYTPLNYLDYDKNLTDMYSSVIHANIISMVLRGDFKKETNIIFNTFLEGIILYMFLFLCDYLFRKNENNYPIYSITSSFLLINFLILFTVFSFKYLSLKFAFGNAILYLILISDSFEIYKKNIERYQDKIKLKKRIILVGLIVLDLLLAYLGLIINNNSFSFSKIFM